MNPAALEKLIEILAFLGGPNPDKSYYEMLGELRAANAPPRFTPEFLEAMAAAEAEHVPVPKGAGTLVPPAYDLAEAIERALNKPSRRPRSILTMGFPFGVPSPGPDLEHVELLGPEALDCPRCGSRPQIKRYTDGLARVFCSSCRSPGGTGFALGMNQSQDEKLLGWWNGFVREESRRRQAGL